MTSVTAFIYAFNILEIVSVCLGFEYDYYLEDVKKGESSFFQSKIWTEYAKLLAVEDSDDFCVGTTEIIFPHSTSTILYYRCQNGRKELYQCIDGFEFDSHSLRCSPDNLRLNGSFVPNECSFQMDGLYPDYETDCQQYYRCKNGIKVENLSCDFQHAFSFHLQSCQFKSEVSCIQSYCHPDNNDFYAMTGSKCQAYYFCRKGFRSDFLCPKGTIFHRQAKTCLESGICYEPICTGRIDGTYADTTHECTRSFRCKGGLVKEVHSCGPEQKHNGYMCTPPPYKTCEKPEKTAAAFYFRANDECKMLQDGSHVVPGTDCRNVRICLRGKTTAAFECPKDQRFNGYRCIPKDIIPCDDVCSMKADGFYADEFTDCQGYYSCLNGKVSRRRQCPHGMAFNGYTCKQRKEVSCLKKSRSPLGRCLGLRDGFHADYLNGCQNYFYCYNHEMVLQGSCSDGMMWNEKQCIEKQDLMCEGPFEMEECLGLSPGLYQNKTSGCTKYFYCNNGSGTKLSCPSGQLFNGDKCLSSDEYTCLSSSDCVNQPDGYRQDKSTGCRSYYYCSNGNKITYVCPDDFIFNGFLCVSSESYRCPFSPSKDCVDKADGYHPDKDSDCKKYYYCFKGEKLNTLICGGKKIFDGEGCILAEDPKTACHGVHNLCRQKNDGIYADPKECRKYLTCKNRTKISENWCPEGFGFNGRLCQKYYLCSESFQKRSNECDGHHIGFHQDLNSSCKNYYFCLGKLKTWGSCPPGTIFNGQLCIDSNYYVCPSKKS